MPPEYRSHIQPRSTKITFANQLRALAVMIVLINHLFGLYFFESDFIAKYVHSPLFQHVMPSEISWLFSDNYNLGPLGVAIFFLISGFVIPFSLERHSTIQFVIARILRIYPTYLCTLTIALVALALSSLAWDQRVRASLHEVTHNILLIQHFSDTSSIDLVSWSLGVEMRFYILAMLLATWIKQGHIWPLFVAPIISLFLNFYVATMIDHPFAKELAMEAMYIGFMFIGTLFYYHYKKLVSNPVFWLVMSAIMIMTLLSWKQGYFAFQYFMPVTVNYLYALVLFGTAYLFRDQFRPISIVDWIAGISYPLYLLHSVIGFTLLQYLMGMWQWSFWPAISLTLIVIFGLAQSLHHYVEIKAQQWGKKFY